MHRPLIPIGEYGAAASSPPPTVIDLPPSIYDEEDSETASTLPPEVGGSPREAAPSSPPISDNTIYLAQGVAIYQGFAIQLTTEEVSHMTSICVAALERQFKQIIEGLKHAAVSDEGRRP